MQKEIRKIGIIGAGGIGLLIGQPLTQHYGKENVFFIVDRERCIRYQKDGFLINGALFNPGLKTPDQRKQDLCDLLVITVKAIDLPEAIEEARSFISHDTIILSLLNGISSEQYIAEKLGIEPMLLAVAQRMDATKTGNALNYLSPGDFSIGEPNHSNSLRLAAVRQCLEQAGIRTNTPEDMPRHMWSKFMLNCGVNQVLAACKGAYRMREVPEIRQRIIAAMEEVRPIARAEGVNLTDDDLKTWIQVMDHLNPDGMPSMSQDILAGRKTEKELFSGTLRRLGKKHNIPTPVNDQLYEELSQLENAF